MKLFKNILYVNEVSVETEVAVERAVKMAENNQAQLTVMDVIPDYAAMSSTWIQPGGPILTDMQNYTANDRRSALESKLRPYEKRISIRLKILTGKMYLEVIRAVLKNGFDLVIKPAENPTWTQRLFGSEDLHLLRKCPSPVLILKIPEESKYSSIMAAVDFDALNPLSSDLDLNREILEIAASLAQPDHATLHIVHAWEAFAESTMLSRSGLSRENLTDYVHKEHGLYKKGLRILTEELRKWIGKDASDSLSIISHLQKGSAKKVIAPLAAKLNVDIVVMGTVARTGISGLIIGNTAETIIDQITTSVLAIKPPGFITPVSIP